MAFVDALARIGWAESLKYRDAYMSINPVLQQHVSSDQQLILNGGPIYAAPTDMSYETVTVHWHTYGVGWLLRENGQYLAAAALASHVVLVFVHVAFTICMRKSMGAWDSITEILLLAWNSVPSRRDEEFKNCSVGVHGLGPMEQKVRAVVVEQDGDPKGRVELVVVDNDAFSKDGRSTRDIESDRKYR